MFVFNGGGAGAGGGCICDDRNALFMRGWVSLFKMNILKSSCYVTAFCYVIIKGREKHNKVLTCQGPCVSWGAYYCGSE